MEDPSNIPSKEQSQGKVSVHNAEWFLECMHSADWTPDDGSRVLRAPKQVVVEKQSRLAADRAARLEKQRTAFAGKQLAREEEFRQQFEDAKREQERRRKARQQMKEADQEKKFEAFARRHAELIQSVAGPVAELDTWKRRRREQLYDEWVQRVFEPTQARIDTQLSLTTPQEVEERRCAMFEAFLSEAQRKPRGMFLDIVDDEYDPLHLARQDTVRYTKASLADDPTKNRGDREAGDKVEQDLTATAITSGCAQGKWAPPARLPPRTDMPVEKWHQFSTTPYGRYNGDKMMMPKPAFNRSVVQWDHYAVPTGTAASKLRQLEFGSGGKRMVNPSAHQSSVLAQGSDDPKSAPKRSALATAVLPALPSAR